jgi:superfamily II DNA/RNA helicase
MHIPPVALTRQHHRLLLCMDEKKQDLLAKLIHENEGKRIAVVFADDTDRVYVPENVTVLTDDALSEETFELLISYDLPADPAQYLSRLALANETALTIFGETDQKNLLGIETLIGRAISQERPEEYAPELPPQPKPKPRAKRAPEKSERPPREPRPEKAPFKKEARPAAKRKPKESGVSRYIGTDENGKPMFSGKTGERNHRKDGKPHTEESIAAKKEWEEKRKKHGGKKPYDAKKKPPFKGGKKPDDAKGPGKPGAPAREQKPESAKPKRPMIRIKAEKLNPKEPKQ